MSDLVKQLREHLDINSNHEAGLIPMSTQIKVSEAADRIAELERELASCKEGLRVEMENTFYHIEQLAAEKALADRLAVMEFDPKIHFAPKKGHGDITVSTPDMRAEIERLEKEVERLKLDSRKGRKDYCDLMDRYNTAWNDAIEAAACKFDHLTLGGISAEIRALKRSK